MLPIGWEGEEGNQEAGREDTKRRREEERGRRGGEGEGKRKKDNKKNNGKALLPGEGEEIILIDGTDGRAAY